MLFHKRFVFQNQEPGSAGAGNPPAPAPAPPEPQTFSREYVQELRQESAAQRTSRKAAEEKLTAAEAAAAKATADAAETVTKATTAANERIIRAELKAEAIKAGMVDLDGLKLADLSKVKLNEAGEVEGADALMTELKKAKPYLFGATQNTSNPAGAPPKPGEAKPKLATEMSKAEYAEQRKNIARGILPKATA